MKKWTLALAFALTLSFGLPTPTLAGHAQEHSVSSKETYDSLMLFGEIFNRILNNHIDVQSSEALIEEAINGMIKSLDMHSVYLKPLGFDEMQQSARGIYSGIGAEVSWDEELNGVIIVSPMAGSPAERDGLKANDIIIEIDGESLSGLDFRQAIAKIKGDPETKVTFKIIREDEAEPLIITVTRGSIEQKVVSARIIGESIMYIRLSQFNENSAGEVQEAIEEMQKARDVFNGLILDLRYNPGGLLYQAIEISNMFLDEGLIVETRERNVESGNKSFASEGQLVSKDLPIVILINEYSASSSEIVAGTLKDLNRATIIGVKSYGKGSVQTVMQLSNNGALKLTIAKYYTAGGTSPHGVGIFTDIEIIMPEDYWDDIPATERSTHIGPQIQKAIDFLEGSFADKQYDILDPRCADGNIC